MNEIKLVLLIIYGMTSFLLRLCANERLHSVLLEELAFLILQEPYCLQEMRLIVQVGRGYEMNIHTISTHVSSGHCTLTV